jgi:hypothetical protein
MTKTQLKREELKAVLQFVMNTFGIDELERDNQYFSFEVAYKGSQLSGQIDTRGFDVAIEQNHALTGTGWSNDDYSTAAHANQLENIMNEKIATFLNNRG